MQVQSIDSGAPVIVRQPAPLERNIATKEAPPAPAAKAEPAKEAPEPDRDQVNQVVLAINKTMKALGRDITFSIDEDSKRTVVKVVDQETGDVIRQMPSAEALEIGKALDKLQGLLIRQSA